jgi:Icc-related predicted phosphoesterase
VRLFFATDIHGSERCFFKFVNAAKAYGVDAIVMGGDITGKLLVPLVDEGDGRFTADVFGQVRTARTEGELGELEKTIRQSGSYTVRLTRAEKEALDSRPEQLPDLFRRAIMVTLARWTEVARERLEPAGIPIFLSAGNDDEFYVDEVLGASPYVECPEGRIALLPGGYEMISCGWANRTPFDSARELDEDALEQRIESMAAQVENLKRAVFNIHCPPRSTSLDSAPLLDETLRPVVRGGAVVMAPAGAEATRRVIERHQPLLALHGHIHESRGAQKLGRTLCVNPGSEYSEGILRGVLVELNKDKIKGWQFTSG